MPLTPGFLHVFSRRPPNYHLSGMVVVLFTYGAEVIAADKPSPIDVSMLGTVELAVPEQAEYGLKLETTLTPTFKTELPGGSRLTLVSRLRTDFWDHLEPGEPDTSARTPINRPLYIGDRGELELRELYWQIPVADFYITLGKQQIVWGTADGLKVLDVVNPQSFREFILPEFDQSRIPLWSINIETKLHEMDVQLVLIPDQSYHQIPRPGDAFAFTSPRFSNIGVLDDVPVPVQLKNPQRPADKLENGDAGIKFSGFWRGWDLSLLYLYHYEDIPVIERRFNDGVLEVTPRYERAHLIGGSFARAFGQLTVRGELGYTRGRALSVDRPSDADGVIGRDVLAAVIGLDWSGFDQWFVSFQLFQDRLTDDARGLQRPRHDATTTLYLRRRFLNDTLIFESRWYANMNDGDGLGRAKLAYELSDTVTVSFGVDWFYGESEGVFGQFGDNDRAVLGLNFGF